MKKIILFITVITVLLIAGSCELDNYDGPNAKIKGSILDITTNELVQQDIISGTRIEYTELGYVNPPLQVMICKVDGTYQNNLMFAGEYSIRPNIGNFVSVPIETVTINGGDNTLDFLVQPYIRFHDVTIQKVGTNVVATFRIEQTVTNTVVRIGLYAHQEPWVGQPYNSTNVQQTINAVTVPTTVYTLTMDLPSRSSILLTGQSYHFRVGALINVPQAKYNYAPAVRITI